MFLADTGLFYSSQFKASDDAVKAMNQLNGFELAGRPMKVGHVTERQEGMPGNERLDNEELERHGKPSIEDYRLLF